MAPFLSLQATVAAVWWRLGSQLGRASRSQKAAEPSPWPVLLPPHPPSTHTRLFLQVPGAPGVLSRSPHLSVSLRPSLCSAWEMGLGVLFQDAFCCLCHASTWVDVFLQLCTRELASDLQAAFLIRQIVH